MKEKDVESVRQFNRFYTNIIGLVDNHLLDSPYSLPEARVIYELKHQQPCTASDIIHTIEMDKGYLSRVLNQFTRKGLINKSKNKEDARVSYLTLSSKGQVEFNKLNKASVDQINSMTQKLSAANQASLVNHMKAIQKLLSDIK